jgi:hypothetical protein
LIPLLPVVIALCCLIDPFIACSNCSMFLD